MPVVTMTEVMAMVTVRVVIEMITLTIRRTMTRVAATIRMRIRASTSLAVIVPISLRVNLQNLTSLTRQSHRSSTILSLR
jgi:hypothetical protein